MQPRKHEKANMLRTVSTLSDETKDLITRVVGCCIDVHRTLGPGLLEAPYCRATALEFDHCGISYTRTWRCFPMESRELFSDLFRVFVFSWLHLFYCRDLSNAATWRAATVLRARRASSATSFHLIPRSSAPSS